MGTILRRRWRKAQSYDIVAREGATVLSALSGPVLYVVPRGAVREYELAEVSTPTFRASLMLANLPYDDKAEAVRAWTNEWGLLTDADQQPVSDFYAVANLLWTQCYAAKMGYWQFRAPPEFCPSRLAEVLTNEGSVERVPADLWGFVWYELMDILSESRTKLLNCAYCHGVFAPKPRAGEKARFCNHNAGRCHDAFHNAGGVPKGKTGTKITWG